MPARGGRASGRWGDAAPQGVGSDAAEAWLAKGGPFVTLAPAPDRRLNPNGGFPLVSRAGFFRGGGSQLVMVRSYCRAPEVDPGPAAVAERCVVRDASLRTCALREAAIGLV